MPIFPLTFVSGAIRKHLERLGNVEPPGPCKCSRPMSPQAPGFAQVAQPLQSTRPEELLRNRPRPWPRRQTSGLELGLPASHAALSAAWREASPLVPLIPEEDLRQC